MKKTDRGYAFLILAGCCAMQGASIGIIANCAGLFYTPICDELGFTTAGLSLHKTLNTLSMALTLPFVVALMRRGNIRRVITAACALFAGSAMAMSAFDQLWQWYVAGIAQGISGAFLMMLPAPVLLNNWFAKGSGMAIGISAACSGLLGMIASALISAYMPVLGWRLAYVISGVSVLALILPFSLFVFRYAPQEMGLRPYGASRQARPLPPCRARHGATRTRLARSPLFWGASVMQVLITWANGFATLLPTYGVSVGLTITDAGMLTSYALAGNTLSKIVFGYLGDKIGGYRAFLLSDFLAVAGFVLLAIGGSWLAAGAFLFGITMPLYTVMLPLILREIWPHEQFGAVLGYQQMLGSILGCFSTVVYASIYDATNSMRSPLMMCAALLSLCLACAFAVNRRKAMGKANPPAV